MGRVAPRGRCKSPGAAVVGRRLDIGVRGGELLIGRVRAPAIRPPDRGTALMFQGCALRDTSAAPMDADQNAGPVADRSAVLGFDCKERLVQ